ncbi:unnamed protein product, partial [Acanthoscelides obtectus]
DFPARVRFYESTFTRNGVNNFRKTHVWSVENPHAVRRAHFQQIFGECLGWHDFLRNILPSLLEDVPLSVRQSMWFLQDGHIYAIDPALTAIIEIRMIGDQTFPDRWIGRRDLSPLDFFMWGHLKSKIYLRQRIVNECLQITPQILQNKNRLRWAKEHRQWTPQQWCEIRWSDEARFEVCVEESLLPVMEECLTSGQDFVFQQDGAACHTSKKAIKWMEENNLPLLKWVSSSPDLSPIETLWHEMKKVLRQHPALLPRSHSFRLVGVQITEDLIWHEHVSSIAAAAGKKLGYLFRAKKYFSPHDLLILYKAQIRPSLEYCSHVWGAAALTTLSMLDAVQRRVIRLIDDSSLTDSLGTLSHRPAVGDLALFYRYTNGFCSSDLSSMMPPRDVPARHTRLTLESHPNRLVSRLWNNLQEEAFPSSTNLRQFKNRINKISLGLS